ELKDKVAKFATVTSPATVKDGTPPATDNTAIQDAVSALVNLGYRQTEAYMVVAGVARSFDGEASVSDLIRLGLKELSQ
ncbi:MAG: hypothetical protein KAI89_09185, partial [Emcibacter sp.]|nr:hypothetical protein [Emcibacter sp.]